MDHEVLSKSIPYVSACASRFLHKFNLASLQKPWEKQHPDCKIDLNIDSSLSHDSMPVT